MNQKKSKPSHSFLSDVGYVFAHIWRYSKGYLAALLCSSVAYGVIYAANPYISKTALDIITDADHRMNRFWVFAAVVGTLLFARLVRIASDRYLNLGGWRKLTLPFRRALLQKRMTTDYENVENTSVSDTFQKAWSHAEDAILDFADGFENGFALVLAMGAFSLTLAHLNPLLVLVTALPAAACYLLERYEDSWMRKNADNWAPIDCKLRDITMKSSDFSRSKDIRLFHMQSWLGDAYRLVWKDRLAWHKKHDQWGMKYSNLRLVLLAGAELCSYLYVIKMVFDGHISAGDFVMYFSSVTAFISMVWAFLENLAQMYRTRDAINFYRDYLDIPDKNNYGNGKPLPKAPITIAFHNVSYTYPGAAAPTIRNLSFVLHAGEKLALVGLNGAGKTTLIKLMCGLYNPTEGVVTCNGVPITEYNRNEYYTLFSTVFQDFDILPVTISQNITQSEFTGFTPEKTADVLQKAGLFDKINSLPLKDSTRLAKSVYDDAADFSGGEMQKLALAKALYKDVPVMILDEPTAALDPIAEHQMYLRYAAYSEGKSSVFISHRLASTRFCDRILLFEQGRIAEEGTHESLLAAGGTYAQLFAVQSQYYKEAENHDICGEN